MSHLLVTNDFPPKVGGIQVYLWELWRRLEPASFAVLTASSDPDAAVFDASQKLRGNRIHRVDASVLLPTPEVARSIRRVTAEIDARLVIIDPAFPLGLLGLTVGVPYGVVLHGAELAAPGRLPVAHRMMREILSRADIAICAGEYPAAEVRRICGHHTPRIVVIPPGVDTSRFRPLPPERKVQARAGLGLPPDGPLVVSVSRLVPRKGMDVLIEAGAGLLSSFPELTIGIGGSGRDLGRLRRLVASTGAPVRLLGKVSEDELPDLYGVADVFVMPCRDRWLGLEQEGFGIVFLEAASCGIPQVAGRSGGASEAVVDGETGFVVHDPKDPGNVAAALRRLLSQPGLRSSMGEAARRRVVESYDYANLSLRLAAALGEMEG